MDRNHVMGLRRVRQILWGIVSWLLFAGSLSAQAADGEQAEVLAKLQRLADDLSKRTLGGVQFWTDELVFRDWRIQQNVLSGHYRLLDGANRRLAAGTFQQCHDQLEAIKKDEGRLDPVEFMQRRTLLERDLEKRKSVSDQKVQRDFDEKRKSIDRTLALQLSGIHRTYKLWAVLLPPIPPLLVGLAVFFQRRAKEREGVSRARLR